MILIKFSFWLHNFISDFVPMNSLVALAVFWATFLEVVFRASSPAFVAVSIKCFRYFLHRFLPNEKYPYSLTFFHVSCLFINNQCQINFFFYYFDLYKRYDNISNLNIITFKNTKLFASTFDK